jgi:7,8-dihydropterin-6-yl-methyl-4-(beta-D-ribofuranosyl)aminobenzene 5'-phosphate synthase
MIECSNISLQPVSGLQIISLVDNVVDLLSSVNKEMVHPAREWVKDNSDFLIADHGFSMIVRLRKGFTILFDTGSNPNSIIRNAASLGLSLQEVDCIVLSHGHWDHVGGLVSTLAAIGKGNIPVIVHKDMFKARGTERRDGTVKPYQKSQLINGLRGANLVQTEQPLLIADGMALVTGEIPRINQFEKGYPKHRILVDGGWKPDPLILDDRALVLSVKGKGLVVISGCAHAGIINTIRYAQKITGIEAIYAVIGGFHLAGKENEDRIGQTVAELRRICPRLVVPSHCTGWRGMLAMANGLPEAFVFGSVGMLYEF